MVKSQPYDTAVHSPNEITLNKFFITSVVPKKRRHFLETALFFLFVDISAYCQYAETSLPVTAILCAVGPWVIRSK